MTSTFKVHTILSKKMQKSMKPKSLTLYVRNRLDCEDELLDKPDI